MAATALSSVLQSAVSLVSGTSKYKLTYFNLRARGEAIRWILHYAGKEFEDHRVEFAQWPAVKPTTPFGHLPVLEEDGKQLGGSMPIALYLSRKFGLAGQDAWEEAQAHALVDFVTDASKDYGTWTEAFMAKDQKKADSIKQKYISEGVSPYLHGLQQKLEQNNNGEGFFLGKKLTWADIVVVVFLDELERLNGNVLDKYPLLKAHSDRVHDLKGIKEWLAVRPDTVL